MSLSITFESRRKVICPHCGEPADTRPAGVADCSGRAWYEFLEKIGYYCPGVAVDDDSWYGKDMTLTDEQAKQAYNFAKVHAFEIYNSDDVRALIAEAIMEQSIVTVRADW